MKKILAFNFVPASPDTALLVLRIWLSLSLFVKHGIEKLFTFPQMQTHFPNPLHVGVTTGLVFALLSDGISSILVMFGFATRIAALVIMLNMFVVFTFMHQFSFMDGHAELVYAYLGGFLTIFIAGPGKYSFDSKFFR